MIMKVSTFLLSVAAVALSGCSNELNDCLLEDGGGGTTEPLYQRFK